MGKLPNFDQAFIDEAKLKEYCLNENHPVGKHKARLFLSKLSLTSTHSSILKEKILEGIAHSEAVKKYTGSYGEQYSVEFKIRNFGEEQIL